MAPFHRIEHRSRFAGVRHDRTAHAAGTNVDQTKTAGSGVGSGGRGKRIAERAQVVAAVAQQLAAAGEQGAAIAGQPIRLAASCARIETPAEILRGNLSGSTDPRIVMLSKLDHRPEAKLV